MIFFYFDVERGGKRFKKMREREFKNDEKMILEMI